MSLQTPLSVIALALLAAAAGRVFRTGRSLSQTSLASAWRWGIAAIVSWVCATVASLAIPEKNAALDQIWLWAAILAVCPAISALGARRPTDRVWNWFIVLPLVAVLGWPAITAWGYADRLVPVRLQLPASLGFLLVLVMGTGNYVGTRITGPGLLSAAAISLSLLPLSSMWTLSRPTPAEIRGLSGVLLGLAVLWGNGSARREGMEDAGFDRLWNDFRDLFGIVWATRIQERINETGRKEKWCGQLGPAGWEWNPQRSAQDEAETSARREQTVRWLLRRFVEPDWIDQRLTVPDQLSGEQPGSRATNT